MNLGRPAQRASCVVIMLAGVLAGCQRVATPAPAPPARTDTAPAHASPRVDGPMASELERAADRGNVCSAREAKAAGLTADYFSSADLSGKPLLTRQEGPLDLDWPARGTDVAQTVRSARWRGWIRPPFSGRFAFHTDIPNARITVSGTALTSAESTVPMNAGRYHPVTIEVRDLQPAADGRAPAPPLKLSWTTPFGARYLLPRAVLFPPSDTVDNVGASGTTSASAAKPASAAAR